jgi:hypothetical protein
VPNWRDRRRSWLTRSLRLTRSLSPVVEKRKDVGCFVCVHHLSVSAFQLVPRRVTHHSRAAAAFGCEVTAAALRAAAPAGREAAPGTSSPRAALRAHRTAVQAFVAAAEKNRSAAAARESAGAAAAAAAAAAAGEGSLVAERKSRSVAAKKSSLAAADRDSVGTCRAGLRASTLLRTATRRMAGTP